MDSAVMERPVDAEQPNDQQPAQPTEAPTRLVNSPPPPTAEELAEARRVHYETILDRETTVRELEGRHEVLKKEAGDAKKAFEAADSDLRWLIAQGPRVPEKFPVKVRAAKNLIMPKMAVGDEFDVVEISSITGQLRIIADPDTAPDGDWVKLGNEVDAIEWGSRPSPPPVAEEVEDESWREENLDSAITITAVVREKLAEVGVNTVGQFEDFRAKVAKSEAVWPKGIGEAKIGKLTDAVLDFLRDWREDEGEDEE